MIKKKKFGNCSLCNVYAELQFVERVPNNGLAVKAIHDNGVEHNWTQYRSINDLGLAQYRNKKQNPKIMICPECGKRGRITAFHSSKNIRQVRYYIAHRSKLNNNKMSANGRKRKQKEVRCHISKANRDLVLKKLGRYIK